MNVGDQGYGTTAENFYKPLKPDKTCQKHMIYCRISPKLVIYGWIFRPGKNLINMAICPPSPLHRVPEFAGVYPLTLRLSYKNLVHS